jgi:mRNA-degrading endonuclease RelE of RelBE toxin-antitoxin system
MAYQIEFTPTAHKQFKKLPASVRQALGPVIVAMAANPKPEQGRLLVNTRNRALLTKNRVDQNAYWLLKLSKTFTPYPKPRAGLRSWLLEA